MKIAYGCSSIGYAATYVVYDGSQPQPDGADLAGSWSAVSQTCRRIGKTTRCALKGTLTVQNAGNIKSARGTVQIYLGSEPGVPIGASPIATRIIAPINAGKSVKVMLNYNLPVNTNASGKYLVGLIDSANTTPETSEDNNAAVSEQIP